MTAPRAQELPFPILISSNKLFDRNKYIGIIASLILSIIAFVFLRSHRQKGK